MNKFWDMLSEIIKEFLYTVKFIVESNLYNASVILELATPYIMIWVVKSGMEEWELSLPLILLGFAYLMRRLAVKSNKAYDMPIPYERFTSADGDGEVTVPQDKLQEMILFVADVEDYLERKGRL